MPISPVHYSRNLRLEDDLDEAVNTLARLASLSLNTTIQGLLALALETCTSPEGLAAFYAAVQPYARRQDTKHTSRKKPPTI